jgi:hypothetical protein
MFAVPVKEGKVQLNLWVSEDMDKALKRLAQQRNLRGRTQMAEIILNQYLDDAATEDFSAPLFKVKAGESHPSIQLKGAAKPSKRGGKK